MELWNIAAHRKRDDNTILGPSAAVIAFQVLPDQRRDFSNGRVVERIKVRPAMEDPVGQLRLVQMSTSLQVGFRRIRQEFRQTGAAAKLRTFYDLLGLTAIRFRFMVNVRSAQRKTVPRRQSITRKKNPSEDVNRGWNGRERCSKDIEYVIELGNHNRTLAQ